MHGFIEVLSSRTHLSPPEREALLEICGDIRPVPARRNILSRGERPHHMHVLVEGWAASYKIRSDGSRQITGFLLPGDICDFHATMLSPIDHSIAALTPVRVAAVPHQALEELCDRSPPLRRALWRSTLVQDALMRSWMVNLGRGDAEQRIAHLLCELHARLSGIGQISEDSFRLPLTQDMIADATGLTSIHVSRMITKLRANGAIILQGGKVRICDVPGLQAAAGFDSAALFEA